MAGQAVVGGTVGLVAGVLRLELGAEPLVEGVRLAVGEWVLAPHGRESVMELDEGALAVAVGWLPGNKSIYPT